MNRKEAKKADVFLAKAMWHNGLLKAPERLNERVLQQLPHVKRVPAKTQPLLGRNAKILVWLLLLAGFVASFMAESGGAAALPYQQWWQQAMRFAGSMQPGSMENLVYLTAGVFCLLLLERFLKAARLLN